MTKKKIIKVLQEILDYPPKGHKRRSDDGYPTEFVYDKFAYERLVDSFRDALKKLIKEIEK